jgi:hypothetical protein
LPKELNRNALVGRWMHSHEEDTDAHTVFRPATFAFPPSRGRKGFELRSDGSMTSFGVGPTDRRESSEGKWKLSGEELTLEGDERKSHKIASVDKEKLVVQK